MKIAINEYYKVEINKVLEFFVKEDYTLTSPYFFIGMNIFGVLYEAILLTKTLNMITFIIYATPLIFGAFLEWRQINIYNKLALGIEKIRKLLYIIVVRLTNISLFMTIIFLMIGNKITENIIRKAVYSYDLNYRNYGFKINIGLLIFFLIVFAFALFFFFIGTKVERKQIIKNKKRTFYPIVFIGGASILFFKRLLLSIPYIFMILGLLFLLFFLSVVVGRLYFRYKNFD